MRVTKNEYINVAERWSVLFRPCKLSRMCRDGDPAIRQYRAAVPSCGSR